MIITLPLSTHTRTPKHKRTHIHTHICSQTQTHTHPHAHSLSNTNTHTRTHAFLIQCVLSSPPSFSQIIQFLVEYVGDTEMDDFDFFPFPLSCGRRKKMNLNVSLWLNQGTEDHSSANSPMGLLLCWKNDQDVLGSIPSIDNYNSSWQPAIHWKQSEKRVEWR